MKQEVFKKELTTTKAPTKQNVKPARTFCAHFLILSNAVAEIELSYLLYD